MEEVVGGAGDVNLGSGESAFDMLAKSGEPERNLGVVGRDTSVDGRRESWEACDSGAWESILPRRWWSKPEATRQIQPSGDAGQRVCVRASKSREWSDRCQSSARWPKEF